MRVGETRNEQSAQWGKPLDGVRILAVEQMQAMPYATQLMSHLGADVIKVEHPVRGESGRAAKPAMIDEDGREVGATYLRNNLGKRSIGLDLKADAGRDLFKRLVPHFDIVAENFKAGTLDRLGLGYPVLAELEPRVILLSISGFGQDEESPYHAWPAYAPIPEAMAGFYEQNRTGDDRPRPVIAGALGDIGSGMFAVIGTLSALRHRDITGLGQHVDIAMYDAMVAMQDIGPLMYSMGVPENPTVAGIGLFAGYRAKDGHFVLHCIREVQFAALATLLGHPEWIDDPRFAERQGWARHNEEVIRPALEEWASGRTKLEACHELCSAGVAAGPSNTTRDNLVDAHVQARGMLIEVPRPDADDPLLLVGNPVKLSRVAEGPIRGMPRLGEHTREVLSETLGLGEGELSELTERGVIA
ncbi:CoA transferase [Myxococcota bacterium]|nr:CoA transferase [Myxococcota bacterium]